jgi:hypothetical protein
MRALALGALSLLLSGCTSESGEGAGSNTNWLTCEQSSDCRGGEVCVAHECTEVTSEPCLAGATLTLESTASELLARQGSFFADALYEPVLSDTKPTDWVDPITIAQLTARVTGSDGEALSGCSLSFLTPPGSGWLFPNEASSDAAGEVHARWVAGADEAQTVTAALVDEDGRAASSELTGQALPHAPDTVAPTLAYVAAALSDTATAVRVRVEPLAAPAHTFFATALPDFFTGLQNTSDRDAFAEEVGPEERILIASVWNRSEGDAELLWSDPDVTCEPHDQGLGGIRCQLAGAWQPGDAKDVIVEYLTLAADEAPPAEYAALGYEALTCTSVAGCTDYSVFLADPDGEPRRLAALRIQNGAIPSGVSSYIDAYGESSATSCLETPVYRVHYGLAERVGDAFQSIDSVTYGAGYELWDNQVCANHGAAPDASGFTVFTGGDALEGRPALPGDDAQRLEVP